MFFYRKPYLKWPFTADEWLTIQGQLFSNLDMDGKISLEKDYDNEKAPISKYIL